MTDEPPTRLRALARTVLAIALLAGLLFLFLLALFAVLKAAVWAWRWIDPLS
jgi:hypothetical protein